jgi:hypothetical protein
MRNFGTWVRAVLTIILLLIQAGWLVVVAAKLGAPIVKNQDGSVVDAFERAKDILLVVTPLLTTALGYWFGSAGRQEAQLAASSARAQADIAQRTLAGVLDSSATTGLLVKAQAANSTAILEPLPTEQPAAPSAGEPTEPSPATELPGPETPGPGSEH